MTAIPYDDGPGVIRYRVEQNSEAIAKLEDWRSEVDKERAGDREAFRNMASDITDLKNLKNWIIGFTITIAGASITFALTVMAATGKL